MERKEEEDGERNERQESRVRIYDWLGGCWGTYVLV